MDPFPSVLAEYGITGIFIGCLFWHIKDQRSDIKDLVKRLDERNQKFYDLQIKTLDTLRVHEQVITNALK